MAKIKAANVLNLLLLLPTLIAAASPIVKAAKDALKGRSAG